MQLLQEKGCFACDLSSPLQQRAQGARNALSSPSAPPPSHLRMPSKPHVEARVREIFMPALSSTMTEGKIVSWSKSEGDKLSKGESVVVVESDKADMDVETFYDGILAAIMVGEGEVAPVGAAIALLAETEDEIAEAKSKAAASATSSSASPAPAVEPVAPITPTPAPAPPSASSVPPPAPIDDGPRRTIATPYAKKLAKQYKVNIDTIVGSGPYGRITATDIETAAGKTPAPKPQPAATPAPVVAAPVAPAASKPASQTSTTATAVPGTVVPFTTMQGAVSRNMVESLSVPTFRVGYTICTDALDALYKKVKSKGVTMTALLAKAVALALAQHPVVNAGCKDGKSFTYNSDINIAVAVAMDGGLLTPVLQNADKVDLYALSAKWKELVDKARAKQLQPHEYNSGTFTLSNLGMFGVDRFDAILPPGTGAIMAVGASQKKVVATANGMLGVKSQMQVNVTADHRIIYGADLAAFLQTFAKILENPDDLTL
ncbi:hypothetical protein GOP47_0021909 [Adiantum capillus-veneris]|uniref:Dihydrolipoamide acetyltransferase component of pyruvate dehydrogenase complex n=1 Tax=Adiantum capillus-veneris TaxID=13818 RepID=A0A9D4U8Q4_ADICA|nr:hypothetical protein GOP47_0021909 [Adiantum capillus-veneris]